MPRELKPRGRALATSGGRKLRGPGSTRFATRNPLDAVPVTGDIEKDDAADGKTILRVLRESKHSAEAAAGNGYWICLVFQSDRQRDEFIRNAKWGDLADSTDTYYDGVALAQRLGVALTPVKVAFHDRRPDARLVREVGIIGKE